MKPQIRIIKGKPVKYMPWTSAEEELLRKYFSTAPKETLLKLFPGRTIASIELHARKLGLRRPTAHLKKAPPRIPKENRKAVAWSIVWEGNIGLHKDGNHIIPIVKLAATDWKAVEEFRKLVGYGKTYRCKSKRENEKPLLEWRIQSINEVKSFIEDVFPYLVSKREQALLVLKFCRKRLKKLRGNPMAPYDGEEYELYKKVKMLNLPLKARRQRPAG